MVFHQSRKNHQILRDDQQLFAHTLSRRGSPQPGPSSADAAELFRQKDLALGADASDGPEEEGPDVAGDGEGETVERIGAGADDGDGGLGLHGEEVEGVDHLGENYY